MHGSPTHPTPADVTPAAERTGQNVSPHDNWSRRALVAILFAPMPWIMRLFAFVHFGAIRVRRDARFPRTGPVILVANHPATWVDVLVLHVALGRKLHFLADEHLYRPRIRAWLLHVFGALPVATAGTAAEREARNEPAFRECRRLLERGEVVAIFPEGVSATDRSLKRFRTGAARILLASREAGRLVPVLPIGIHYIDRVAFRTRVVVSIGEPVRFALESGNDARERAEWITHATDQLERAVAELILELPKPSLRATVEELLPFLADSASDVEALAQAKRLAARIAAVERADPAGFAAIARHADRHRRIRAALGLGPRDAASRSRLAWLAIVTAAGAIPACAGLMLHALPAYVTQYVARRFDPTRVTLMRIGVGWVSFSAWYALIAVVAVLVSRSWLGLAAPLAAAALGVVALAWSDAWREWRARFRWSLADRREPFWMSRLRREEETVVRLIDQAERRPRARTGAGVLR